MLYNVNGFDINNLQFLKIKKRYAMDDSYNTGIEYTFKIDTGAHVRAIMVEHGYKLQFDWLPLPNDDSVKEIAKCLE